MSYFFLDSSAVVKRYQKEVGSERVIAIFDQGADHAVILGEITLVEVAAAFAAKHRAPNGLTRSERDQAVALFLSHCDMEYELAAVNRFIIDRAVILTQNHKLRGYDAVQLATALSANAALTAAGLSSLTFVAADDDLVAAARAEGLTAENPNAQL